MSGEDANKNLEDLIDAGTVVMIGTSAPDGALHSRPITVAAVDGGRVSCIVDGSADWVVAAPDGTSAHVTLSDSRANTWVSLNATLSTTRSPVEIDRVWSAPAGNFFEGGREDPNVTVLHLDCRDGTYWSTPSGRLGSLVAYARAKLGGADDAGDHGAVHT